VEGTDHGCPADVSASEEEVLKDHLGNLAKIAAGFHDLLRELLVQHGKRLDDHGRRIREIEDFRLRTDVDRKRQEQEMNSQLARIEKHLEDQDEKLDSMSRTTARWAGGLALAALLFAVFGVMLWESFARRQ